VSPSYPNLLRRYLATIIDVILMWLLVFGAVHVPVLRNSSWGISGIAAAVVLLYEPPFTALFCTLGQWIMRIRVRRHVSLRRLPLTAAYTRVIAKYLLGAISVLTIPANAERRGIHDFVADSVVIESRSATR
jgi:uncharacterized RDD family membrane protein YckC